MLHTAVGTDLASMATREEAPRFSLLVRVTHWLNAISFVALVVSGVGILLSHPRFYWGETGGVGGPSLFDLPLPFMLGGPSGWGRYMHFQFAWLCVLTGLLYLVSGFVTEHFGRELRPAAGQLTWDALKSELRDRARLRRPAADEAYHYGLLQRIAYLVVIFALFPFMIWTGMAMSPAITSVFPIVVTSSGGYQSARTLHFFAGIAILLFVVVHIVMVWRAGFVSRTRAMITGRAPACHAVARGEGGVRMEHV
jgi:thiosulfate reductase cytochrome b subunit